MFTFFSALTLFFLSLTRAEAQRTPRIPRIGILVTELGPSESQTIKGLREGLKELGYKEGQTILVEMRNAKGDRAALKPAASELVSQKVNLIFTTGSGATQAAKAATKEIPVVFRFSADPVVLGFVKSMTRPGGNVTGVAGLSWQMTEKRLEILKEILPRLRRVLIFYDANNPFSRGNFAFAQNAAAKFGLEVAEHPIKSAEELKLSLNGLQKREGDALFHVSDDLVESQASFLFEAARQKGLPTMFEGADWAAKGSLAGYGPNHFQMGRQAAHLVDRILKGQKPENLPVERANKFDLVINFRVANAMGLPIPAEVLKKADKVIR